MHPEPEAGKPSLRSRRRPPMVVRRMIRMPTTMNESLERLAHAYGVSVSALVREAIAHVYLIPRTAYDGGTTSEGPQLELWPEPEREKPDTASGG